MLAINLDIFISLWFPVSGNMDNGYCQPYFIPFWSVGTGYSFRYCPQVRSSAIDQRNQELINANPFSSKFSAIDGILIWINFSERFGHETKIGARAIFFARFVWHLPDYKRAIRHAIHWQLKTQFQWLPWSFPRTGKSLFTVGMGPISTVLLHIRDHPIIK